VIALILAHTIFFGLLSMRSIGQMEPLELLFYDYMLAKQSVQLAPDDRIRLVWFKDKDQRNWGWPLSDENLATVLDILVDSGALIVGLDLYRDMPVPFEKGAGYAHLTDTLQKNENIIGITKFADTKGAYVAPPPALEGTGRVTFNDVTYDTGYIVRRGLLFLDDGEKWYEYFGLRLVLAYLETQNLYLMNSGDDLVIASVDEHNQLNEIKQILPKSLDPNYGAYVNNDSDGYQFMFSYPAAPNAFRNVSLGDVLERNFPENFFRNKIVVIGTNAEATPDFFSTPIGRWLDGDQRMPGALLHAYATSQILQWTKGQNKALRSWNDIQEVIWIWFWTLSGVFICLWSTSFWLLFFYSVSGSFAILGLGYLAFYENLWIISTTPVLGWVFGMLFMTAYQAYQNRSERAALMNIFSKHVSKEVAEVIWQSRNQYLDDGRLLSQRLTATVLFTDLQNFTTVSESMEPQALMDWLNEYMSAMVKVVEEHHGQVNKFIGDAVMAVFGIPIAHTSEEEIAQDARNAVSCALAMRREIIRLRKTWEAQGMPTIRMRVGIFTGPLVAGSLGGEERQEYTVLGDTVNTAARLESFDKTFDMQNPCRILIGSPTLQCLDDTYDISSVGSVSLKGKASQVSIHLVNQPSQNVTSDSMNLPLTEKQVHS
jgi:adenylate cyclase